MAHRTQCTLTNIGSQLRFPLSRSCSLDLLLLLHGGPQDLLQLTSANHLVDNVSATHKLTTNVQLGDGGPLAVVLDGLPQAWVVLLIKHIHNLVLGLDLVQDGQHLVAEAAGGLGAGALDKGNHLAGRGKCAATIQ